MSKHEVKLLDVYKITLKKYYKRTPIVGRIKNEKIVIIYDTLRDDILLLEIGSRGLKELCRPKLRGYIDTAPAVTSISNRDFILFPIRTDNKDSLHLYALENDGVEFVDCVNFNSFICSPVVLGLGKERYAIVGSSERSYVISFDSSGFDVIRELPISGIVRKIAVTDINGEKFATVSTDRLFYLIQLSPPRRLFQRLMFYR